MISINSLLPTSTQLQLWQKNLTNTLNSSLNNVPINGVSYLSCPLQKINTASKKIQFIVIGGSQSGSAVFDTQISQLTQEISIPTPSLSNTKQLCTHVTNLISTLDNIVMIFTFPIQPVVNENEIDGVLLRGTKKHVLTDLVGKQVGKVISNGLPHTPKIDLINDISALLMTSKNTTFVAGVVGTGFNFGINNTKTKETVNFELGNFNNFIPDEATQYIDAHSVNPNQQLWEKSISGFYLPQHFNFWAKYFNISYHVSSASELSNFAVDNQVESQQSKELARILLQNSAAKTAVTIASLSELTQSKQVTLEGSVFWKADNYRAYTQEYLALLGKKDIDIIQANSAFENLISIVT